MKTNIILTAVVLYFVSPLSYSKPLKVFILAGQSNMQGHVNVSTFDAMADDRKTAPILKEMLTADCKPKICDKVWISSIGGNEQAENLSDRTSGEIIHDLEIS